MADAQEARDRRLVEQAASLAVGVVIAAIRDGAHKKAAGTEALVTPSQALTVWAGAIEEQTSRIVEAVTQAITSADRRAASG
jgi:predicted branched-subunit amino acid permease